MAPRLTQLIIIYKVLVAEINFEFFKVMNNYSIVSYWPGIFNSRWHGWPIWAGVTFLTSSITVSRILPDGSPPTFTMKGLPGKKGLYNQNIIRQESEMKVEFLYILQNVRLGLFWYSSASNIEGQSLKVRELEPNVLDIRPWHSSLTFVLDIRSWHSCGMHCDLTNFEKSTQNILFHKTLLVTVSAFEAIGFLFSFSQSRLIIEIIQSLQN